MTLRSSAAKFAVMHGLNRQEEIISVLRYAYFTGVIIAPCSMAIALNDASRAAALDFAHRLGSSYRAQLGAQLNWTENAQRFAAMDVLSPSDHKAYIRTLLYPSRLVYSWTTGRMASNDDAVAFTCEHRPPGLNTDLLTRALAHRQAGSDPDALFSARAGCRIRSDLASDSWPIRFRNFALTPPWIVS
jgi:hypothetical protein